MCRPCSVALEAARAGLSEITGRLREDEYDRKSLPADLRCSFMILAELARMMHLPGLDGDIEALAGLSWTRWSPFLRICCILLWR